MTDGFQPRPGGGAVATFHGFEAEVLRSLAAQLVELLSNESAVPSESRDPLESLVDFTGPSKAPDDPVLQRLLPAAYRDDEESAAEFRRFTEGELRTGKAACAGAVIAALDDAGLDPDGDADRAPETLDVELDADGALSWLKALNDMRLALATRLGIEDDDDLELLLAERAADGEESDDPRAPVLDIYDWLSYLQETLVSAVGGH